VEKRHQTRHHGVFHNEIDIYKDKISTEHVIRHDLAFGPDVTADRGRNASIIDIICLKRDNFPPKHLVFLPGVTDSISSATGTRLFSYDTNGNTCFTLDQARQASEKLASIDLLGKVLERLKSGQLNLVLPQQSVEVSQFFCNETVYGNYTLLMCTGLVLLEG
jgi:hypothetical protein